MSAARIVEALGDDSFHHASFLAEGSDPVPNTWHKRWAVANTVWWGHSHNTYREHGCTPYQGPKQWSPMLVGTPTWKGMEKDSR